MRWLSLGGILGPVLFTALVAVLGALRPGYSHVAHFISELGASGTQYAAVMNYAGFVTSGLLLAALGISLFHALPRRALAIAGAALVTLFGALVAASGIASCDPGCPQALEARELTGLWQRLLLATQFAWCAVLGLGFRRAPGPGAARR